MSGVTKSGRGGARVGAGRKGFGENPKSCTFYLPEKTIARLTELAADRGVSKGQVLAELVDAAYPLPKFFGGG